MSARSELENLAAFEPNWSVQCEVCDATPVVSETCLCGPCTFGEADTVAGGWWSDENAQRLKVLRSLTEGQGR